MAVALNRSDRSRPGRTAVARAAGAAGALLLLLGRAVRLVAAVVAAILVVGIILRVAGANAHNSVVSDIHDAGRALVGPFRNVFTVHDPKGAIALNWGLAALVYLIAGSVIASLLARLVPR